MMGRDSIPRLLEPGVRARFNGGEPMATKGKAMGFPPKKTTGKAVSKKSKSGVKKAGKKKKMAPPPAFGGTPPMPGGFGAPGGF